MPLLRRLTALAGAVAAGRAYARKNPDKVDRVATAAGRFVNKKTRGRYQTQVDGAIRRLRSATR